MHSALPVLLKYKTSYHLNGAKGTDFSSVVPCLSDAPGLGLMKAGNDNFEWASVALGTSLYSFQQRSSLFLQTPEELQDHQLDLPRPRVGASRPEPIWASGLGERPPRLQPRGGHRADNSGACERVNREKHRQAQPNCRLKPKLMSVMKIQCRRARHPNYPPPPPSGAKTNTRGPKNRWLLFYVFKLKPEVKYF